MYNKKQLVEILSQKKKKLLKKQKRIISKMEEENSALETQIAILQNKALANRADAIKKANIITPRINQLIRDIKSAREYIDEVTDKEIIQYKEEQRDAREAAELKNGPEMIGLNKSHDSERFTLCHLRNEEKKDE